jgi:Rad3-related DNA helicase
MSLKAGESFFSYSVPEAIIKFRQGTGRLIRSPQDRGALIVLDKRIVTKNYGKRFVRSLDGDMKFFSNIDDIIKSLESFFSGKAEEEISGITYTPFEDM